MRRHRRTLFIWSVLAVVLLNQEGVESKASGDSIVRPGVTAAGCQGGVTGLRSEYVVSPSPVSWPQNHFDAAHTGFNPYETTLSASNVAGLKVLWTAHKNTIFTGGILVVGRRVYAAGAGGVFAFGRGNGSTVWAQPLGNSVQDIAYLGGRIFVGTVGDHRLHAYDAATGRKLWEFQANGAVGGPTVAPGVLYVETNAGERYAIDPRTGHPIWSVFTGGTGGHGPALARNIVIAGGGDDRNVQALDAGDGSLLWTTPVDGSAQGSPSIADELVFVATAGFGAHSLYALSLYSGEVCWRADLAGVSASTPAVANGIVYVGDEFYLYAFDEMSGGRLWRKRTRRGFVLSSPTVANGVVYAATLGAYAFDAITGQPLWSSRTDIVNEAPSIVDGVLYVGDFSGNLRAYALP